MIVVVEPFPDNVDEFNKLVDKSPNEVALCVSKLFTIWSEREQNGFGIDGPGEIRTLLGPKGEDVVLTIYRYPRDYAAGIVAVDQKESFARILNVGAQTNQRHIDSIYKEGLLRLTNWISDNGSLQ